MKRKPIKCRLGLYVEVGEMNDSLRFKDPNAVTRYHICMYADSYKTAKWNVQQLARHINNVIRYKKVFSNAKTVDK